MDPSWHHNYASLAWTGGHDEAHRAAHYPSIKPELVELTSALHGLAHDAELRAQYMADAPAFADRFQLPPDQREALIKLDLAVDRENGRAPPGSVSGAIADSAAAPAAVAQREEFPPRVPDAVQRETKWSGAPLIRDRHRP